MLKSDGGVDLHAAAVEGKSKWRDEESDGDGEEKQRVDEE
jgi:hypothetical protein